MQLCAGKRIHILGIGGTFMGGLAQIAQRMGYQVTGQDYPLYPPMSTQLEQQGIVVRPMDDVDFIKEAPDMVVVGNIMKRGMVAVEALLESQLRYTSGPQWLHDYVLVDKWVLAVSGTHGKTTTSSMLAWILRYAQLDPGFLIGGVAHDLGVSAHYSTKSPFFVVEADEYDSAFFDKRAKLVHYCPRTWVINNLEFDHADIYADLAQIQRQFHHGVRLVPASGLLVTPAQDQVIEEMLALGCWSQRAQHASHDAAEWSWKSLATDASAFQVVHQGKVVGEVKWSLMGVFNVHNAMSAIIAAQHAGIPIGVACEALSQFNGVARRLTRLVAEPICVYEDFAHHPTAIAVTLQGLRAKVGSRRIIAVLEPRSNSMRMGVFKDQLAKALMLADMVFMYRQPDWQWDIPLTDFHQPVHVTNTYEQLLTDVQTTLQPDDVVVCMSNGGFAGVPSQLATAVTRLG